MNMQDKDLDQLFRTKLEGLEAEPSAGVWANISNGLDRPKQRKSTIPLLRIAASIVVLISAGLFFLPKRQIIVDKPKNGKSAQNQQVKLPVTVLPVDTLQQTPVIAQVQQVSIGRSAKAVAVIHHTTAQQITIKAEQTIDTDPAKTTNPLNTQQQVLVAANNTNVSISKPVVPDATVPLVDKRSDITPDVINKPAAILAAIPDKETSQIPAKKRKIRGLGGFINAVVGVVDKRADKIIEFTDTDEGNTLTGLNLGIISIKKNQ